MNAPTQDEDRTADAMAYLDAEERERLEEAIHLLEMEVGFRMAENELLTVQKEKALAVARSLEAGLKDGVDDLQVTWQFIGRLVGYLR